MNDLTPIGHNSQFAIPRPEDIPALLNAEYGEIVTRKAALVEAGENLPLECGNEETAANLTDYVSQCTALVKKATDAHKAGKDPYLNGGRAVDGWLNGIKEPVERAKGKASETLRLFMVAKAAREAADRERAAKAAREQAEQLAAAAKTEADLEVAIAVESAAVEAEERAEAKTATMARTHGVYGAVATLRTTWGYEVADAKAVPREFLCVDDAALKAAIKAATKTDKTIDLTVPGVRFVATQAAVARR